MIVSVALTYINPVVAVVPYGTFLAFLALCRPYEAAPAAQLAVEFKKSRLAPNPTASDLKISPEKSRPYRGGISLPNLVN